MCIATRYILHGAPADNQLAALGVSDPNNSADSQTCTYAYDDLARLDNDNCGSTWSQSFSDDAFGNLSKSGSISFAPTYNLLNQVSVVGGYNPTYDADGNMTSDTVNTYNWDSDGNMIKAVTLTATTNVTYDAMDRAVEFEVGSAYTQIVYGPGGGKLALMNGQSLTKAFVPLAGGAVAVYNASGLQYYRHGDWLGSSRLASTPSRGVYYDGAYAPYGENYAESGTKDRSFTGQDQDMVSSGSYPLYDFLMREYHPTWGRWISPDPAGLAAVNPANPQTWNRYAYVGNNPMSMVDPLGLSGCTYTILSNNSSDISFEITCNGKTTISDIPCYSYAGCGFMTQGEMGLIEQEYDSINGDAATNSYEHGGSGNSGGGGGGGGSSGFTLSIRTQGQTWVQCMGANANTYSIGGAIELTADVALNKNTNISEHTSALTGNSITGLLFDGPGPSEFVKVGGYAAGSPLTFGRRTSDIMSLNLAGKGGLPKALESTGAGGLFETAGKWLSLGLDEAERGEVDAGLAGAEAINCAIP